MQAEALVLENKRLLSSKPFVELRWTIDNHKQEIQFGVVAETVGYIGLGISPTGSMTSADIAIVRKGAEGAFQVSDHFSREFAQPKEDKHNHFILLAAERNTTHTSVHFKRKIITCDDDDFDIPMEPSYIIWAIGSSDDLEYHSSRGSLVVSLFFQELDKQEPSADVLWNTTTLNATRIAEGTNQQHALDISLESFDFEVPSAESSSYTCFKVDMEDQLGASPVYFNAFKGLSETDPRIHHAHLYECDSDTFEAMETVTSDCYGVYSGCRFVVSWAVGLGYAELPQNVGNRIGCDENGEDCKNKVVISTHYENIHREQGVKATFTFRLFLQSNKPVHEYGFLQVAVPHGGIEIPAESVAKAVTDCPAECTSKLAEGGVQVVGVVLHAHLTATIIRLRHVRDGQELKHLAEVDKYDFNKQSLQRLARRILPGDRLVLECEYENNGASLVQGGFTTQDEMCLAVLAVYPKPAVAVCSRSLSKPGFGYCGPDVDSAQADKNFDLAPLENFIEVQPAEQFKPLSRKDEICYIITYKGLTDPTDLLSWTIPHVVLLVAMFMTMRLAEAFLTATSKTFRGMGTVNRRNVLVYIVSTAFLTVSFVFSVVGIVELFTEGTLVEVNQENGMTQNSRTAATVAFSGFVVGFVMVFELFAKVKIDAWLVAHHILTLVIISVLYMATFKTLNVAFLQIGVILAFTASTEQPMYIALIRKRFGAPPKSVYREFVLSAVYTFVSKTGIYIASMVWYTNADLGDDMELFRWVHDTNWDSAMRLFIPVSVTALYIIQVRLCFVLIAIANASLKKVGDKSAPANDETPKSRFVSRSSSDDKPGGEHVLDLT